MDFAPNQLELTISVLFGEPSRIIELLAEDVPRIENQAEWTLTRGEFSLDDAFTGSPMQGMQHPRRVLAFTLSEAGPVILTANIYDGWNSLAFRNTIVTGGRALVLTFSKENGVEYPARGFAVYEAGVQLRGVRAYRDSDGWRFGALGQPILEEDTTQYSARLIKDRVTNTYLIGMASAIGVPLLTGPLRGYGVLIAETKSAKG